VREIEVLEVGVVNQLGSQGPRLVVVQQALGDGKRLHALAVLEAGSQVLEARQLLHDCAEVEVSRV